MSKAAKSATLTKTPEPSHPAGAPAVSRAAPVNGSTPAPQEPDYELPTAAEIAGEMRTPAAEPVEDGIGADEAGADITPQAPVDETEESDEDEASAPEPEAAEGEEPPAAEDDAAPAEAEGDDAEPEKPEPTRFQKRIDELTERSVKAEQETAQLREQLAAARQGKAPDPLNPFNLVDTEQELAAAVDREEQFMEWIMEHEANPDGGDLPDGKGATVHFEPEQIRQMKVATYRILRTAEKRREFLRAKAGQEAQAQAAYPWLRSTKDGLGAEVQSAIEARPYLRQSPDYRTFAADAVMGAKLRTAGIKLDERGLAALLKGRPIRTGTAPAVQPGIAGAAAVAARAGSPAPVRRLAPSPARPGSLPPKLNGREAQSRQANRALAAGSGNVASIEDSIAAKFRW